MEQNIVLFSKETLFEKPIVNTMLANLVWAMCKIRYGEHRYYNNSCDFYALSLNFLAKALLLKEFL